MKEKLTIALPKGKLMEPTIRLLASLGLPYEDLNDDMRKLTLEYDEAGICYILCRPTDVPTYVEYGAADVGIVGKDVILEQGKDVYEMADLGFGYCRFVVAVPCHRASEPLENFNYQRVATKFPRVTENFFRQQGMQVEVIELHGNIELAPRAGLAEMIVDIVSTGKTLKENNLIEKASIAECTARLIVNRVSYRTKSDRIEPLVKKIKMLKSDGLLNI